MNWGLQQAATVLLVVVATTYLVRHVLRSLSTSRGDGCGVASGCKGCASRASQCINEAQPGALVTPTIRTRP